MCRLKAGLEDIPERDLASYQAIVLADVLEHILNPEASLSYLASMQNQDCVFIISMPNVANLWVRLNLLFGRFEYTDRGILDRTHLHFYTKASLTSMITRAGLSITKIKVTPIPLGLVHPFFAETKVGWFIQRTFAKVTQLFPTLLGYQFVLMAQRQK